MKPDELDIPPDALTDPNAFELLRLWAANEHLHVTISSSLGGTAEDFGEVLADLFDHATRLYAQREDRKLSDCREAMLANFLQLMKRYRPDLEGSIQ